MPPSAQLTENIHSSTELLLQALERPELYLEILLVGVTFTVAVLVGMLMRSFLRRHLPEMHATEKFGLTPAMLDKPLSLLTPLLAVILLTSVQPIAEQLVAKPLVVLPAAGLAGAWLLIRLVMMVVSNRPVAWFISLVILVYSVLAVSGFMHFTATYLEGMGFTLGKYNLTLLGLIQGIVIFVIVFWLASSSSRAMEMYLNRSTMLSYSSRELIKKFFTLFIYFVAILVTLGAMGVDLTALAVFGGALGVGIGLGLQKITSNFVGGVTLLLEKSIKLGDLIEVGNNSGWVRKLHMRYALIETHDGREVLIPNEELINSRVTNWTYSNEHARIDIRVMVAYESDARRAQAIMLETAKAHPLCLKDPTPHCWLREFGDSGLVFLLTFWIPDIKEGRFTPQSEVMFSILDKFKQEGIEIPYPKQVHLGEPGSDAKAVETSGG